MPTLSNLGKTVIYGALASVMDRRTSDRTPLAR